MANNVFLCAKELGLNPTILDNRTVSELIALADYVVPAMDVIRNLSGLYDLDHPTTRKDAEKLFFTFAK